MSLTRPITSIFRAAAPVAIRAIPSSSPIAATVAATPNHLLLPTTRSKHSATQVKRLFKKNPARLRIEKRKENDLAAAIAAEADTLPEMTSTPPPSLPNTSHPQISTRVYPPVFKPSFLKNGWSAPPGPEVEIPEYPFQVERTGRKPFGAVGFLPVYTDVRIHGTKHTTIIRNVTGDIPAFLTELRAVLELPIPKKIITTSASNKPTANSPKHGGGEGGRGVNAENPMRIRAGGNIEVNGNRSREVRGWLAGLGF